MLPIAIGVSASTTLGYIHREISQTVQVALSSNVFDAL